jgi:hypothetical protein
MCHAISYFPDCWHQIFHFSFPKAMAEMVHDVVKEAIVNELPNILSDPEP